MQNSRTFNRNGILVSRKGLPGLTAQLKEKLIAQSLQRRLRQAGTDTPAQAPSKQEPSGAGRLADIPEAFYRFDSIRDTSNCE